MDIQAQTVVAVVENDAAMLKALGRLLRAAGYRAELYASAEAFIARDAAPRVGCVVLDIDLGGISGIELQQRLADAGAAPPIVFVTSQVDAGFQHRAEALGCLAYLRKPFASRQLMEALQRAPGLSRLPSVSP
jgi:FixJ family two-component response regulator